MSVLRASRWLLVFYLKKKKKKKNMAYQYSRVGFNSSVEVNLSLSYGGVVCRVLMV